MNALCTSVRYAVFVLTFLIVQVISANAQSSAFASLTYPLDLATQVNPTVQFTWTGISGAQAYYLYVGSAPGLKDAYDSGETSSTALTVKLAVGTTYYARLYTKINNTWQYAPDISFTTVVPAALLAPAHQASNIQNPVQFTWSKSSGASAYYLYVGTSLGAKDVVNSGEIRVTGITRSLSAGTYYARVYTLINACWYVSSDITFSIAPPPSPAQLTFPANSATQVITTVPFAWNAVTGAQVYYLYVGSAPGLKDVYDGGETTATSATVRLAPSKQYYARLYTKINGLWFNAPDVAFSTLVPSSLISPANGATLSASSRVSFGWTAVPNASVYYLYVGTSPGAKDVIDPGETKLTQLSHSLPPGTYYARVYTEVSQSWFSSADISFLVANFSTLASPQNGATNVDPLTSFSWASVAGASGYSLAVGTLLGASDAFSTGTLTSTSFQNSSPLQPNTTYYATLGTLQGTTWVYSASSFATGTGIAHLLFPTNGATNIDPFSKLKWNAVIDAQTYYVYVGSALGLKDVYDSGEIAATNLTVPTLKPNTQYFIRLSTKKNSQWYSTDSSFTTGNGIAQMLYPVNGATDVDPAIAFSWSTDPQAITYYLYVGTAVGAKDIYDSGETTDTSRVVPVGAPGAYYIRLFTRRADGWHYNDSSFTLGDFIAHLTTPPNRGLADPDAPFVWTTVPNAAAYYLYVGTTVGAKDVYGSGEVTTNSVFVSNLVPGTNYYARLFTYRGGEWDYSDTTFLAGQGAAQLTDPLDGGTISPFETFTWSPPDGGADAYYLIIGSTAGARDVFDSGQIQGTSLQPAALGFAKTYYATLYTLKSNIWRTSSATFKTLDQASVPNLAQIRSGFYSKVQQATSSVRMMADPNTNVAVPGTPLANFLTQNGLSSANCSQYATVLVQQLQGSSVGGRLRYITLTGTPYESHTTTEYYDPFLDKWSIADATFGVMYFAPATQTGQSVEDIQALVLANNFPAISVTTVTNYGDSILRGYYMDPLTLYTNVFPAGQNATYGPQPHSPMQFLLQQTPLQNIVGQAGTYIFTLADSEQAQLMSAGTTISITALNGTGFSNAVILPSGWTITSAPADLNAYTFVRPAY